MRSKHTPIYGDRYGIASLAMVIMLCLFAYTKSSTLMWITLASTVFFITRPDVIFPVMYIASLSGNVFSIESGVSISRYLSLIFIASCIASLISQGKHINSKNAIIAVFVILLTFVSIIMGYDGSITFFVVMLTNLLVFFLFQEVRNVDLEKLLGIISVSSLIALSLLWYFASRDSLFLMSDRFNLDGEANSNNLAMMVEQIGSICIAYVVFGKNKIIRLVSVVGVLGSISLILLTGSRSALIALLSAMAICMIVIVRKSDKSKTFSTAITVLILFVVGYFFITFISGIDNPILDRFSVADVRESGGAGRTDNIQVLMTKIFPEHLLFGAGMGNANMQALGKSYGLSHPAHNIIIDPLTQMGLLLFVVYVFFLMPVFKIYFKMLKSRKTELMIVVAMVTAVIVNGIGEVMFYEKMFWCDIALLVLAYKQCVVGQTNHI